MSKGPKGCPRRRGEAHANAGDKTHSANLKRQQRARQNHLVSVLDSLLPTGARCKPYKGAGPRSTGLQGRSVLNVLADCVQLIKTAHLQAAALVVDAAGHPQEDHVDEHHVHAEGARAEGPHSNGDWGPRSIVTTLESSECGHESLSAERIPICSVPPRFYRAESGTEATVQERERWLDFHAQQACDEIFQACCSGLSLDLPPVRTMVQG